MKKNSAKKLKPLSIQQQRFANNILKGLNATDAYIEAGYKARGNSAESKASRLVRNGKVQIYIEKVQEKANIAAEITQEKILNEESRLAFYDPKELFDPQGKQLPIHKLPKNIRLALHGLEITETALGGIKYKYKFHEKGKALERLEKIEGMNSPEKHLIDLDGKIEIIDSYALPDEDKKKNEDPA